jgi:predicted homoserine dehydrogenase-like protein
VDEGADRRQALIENPDIEVIIEATGDPGAGIRFALAAIENGKHIVMVNVEADSVAGPLLARKAKRGRRRLQPRLGRSAGPHREHVDWARACGFRVVAAGKGTRYHPTYHQSTPDTVWDILDKYMKITDRNSINPKMFNSFVDGTKSGIEMTAVCNATGLQPQTEGLSFPPATRFEHAEICKPKADGGVLEKAGVTEVDLLALSRRHGRAAFLVMGTYVVFESDSAYSEECFREYSMLPDSSGKYAASTARPHDRSRARPVGRLRSAAQGADRRADLLQLGRRRHRQARPQEGRDAGRRGRLLRLGQADAGRDVAEGGLSAARPRPQRQAQARHRRRYGP